MKQREIIVGRYLNAPSFLSLIFCDGTARFFTILMIIEGATEKVLQFILPLKSIYIKNYGFNEQNVILYTYERFKQENLY